MKATQIIEWEAKANVQISNMLIIEVNFYYEISIIKLK